MGPMPITAGDPLAAWLRSAGSARSMLVKTRLAKPWGMRVDQREEVVLHLVGEGDCFLRSPGAAPIQLFEGDLAVRPRGDGHELAGAADTPAAPLEDVLRGKPSAAARGATTLLCGTYVLDANLGRPLVKALPPTVVFRKADVARHPQLAATLALLVGELDAPEAGSEIVMGHLFDALFLFVVRAWAAGARVEEQSPSWLGALRDDAVARALAKLHDAPAKEWSIDALAKAVGLSRAALAKRFTQAIGEPPLTYLTRWRIGLAARMLADTDEHVAEVARRVGYASEFSFSRAFKRAMGVSPSGYRDAPRARRA